MQSLLGVNAMRDPRSFASKRIRGGADSCFRWREEADRAFHRRLVRELSLCLILIGLVALGLGIVTQ